MNIPIPAHGERALVVGRSGSGKTQFSKWMLWHMPGAIIYDTKGESAFDEMGPVVSTTDDAFRVFAEDEEADFVVVRPEPGLIAYPMALDEMLLDHYDRGDGVTAYLDEAYQFHKNGRPGPGYLSLLTRGRSRDITTITGSQRPAFLSLFAFTELNHLYAMRLQHDDDRARLANIIAGYDRRPKVPMYHVDYARADTESIRTFPPIDIDYRPDRLYREKTQGPDLPARSQYFNWI